MKADHTADMEALLVHAGWLRRFAQALVKDADAAEDLAQETMVAAWRHKAGGAGRPWLARVARNLAINRFRGDGRRQRRELAAQALDAGRVSSPEELIGDAQIHRVVAEVVSGLDEPFRQTLVLRFFHGESSADIARRLRVPYGTVRWRVKEGLDRVRRELDARHGHDRAHWVAALTPLLPRLTPAQPAAGVRQTQVASGFSKPAVFGVAALAVSAVCLVAVVIIIKGQGRQRAADLADDKTSSAEMAFAEKGAASVRFNVAALAITQDDAAQGSGPGRLDAEPLVAELLLAVQNNDYDAFVAKGGASFKAGVRPAGFHGLSKKLGDRLAHGHQPSLLGSVRRAETVDWSFKVEFADGGDDALVSLAMDGWQVAGLIIDDPITLPTEK